MLYDSIELHNSTGTGPPGIKVIQCFALAAIFTLRVKTTVCVILGYQHCGQEERMTSHHHVEGFYGQ